MTEKPKLPPHRSLVEKNKALPASLDKKAYGLAKAIFKAGQASRENIPNASLVYGIASALFFAVALYYLFTGAWFNGFLVFVLGVALFGYALHFLQNPD